MIQQVWLIELVHPFSPAAFYFSGLIPCFNEYRHQIVLPDWSQDRTRAVMFARQQDARTMAIACGVASVASIVQYGDAA